MKKSKGFLMFFLLFRIFPIYAEIEKIEMQWNAFKCLDTCVPLIEMNLNAIKHASNVQINGRSGAAAMGWNPNYPFSYTPFRMAAAAVGINIDEMRLRVRGTISHDADNFYLTSTGDNSRFLLIGPLKPEPGRYIPPGNLATHPLPPRIKEELLAAQRRGFTVVISGPLFLPNHYPRTLITEQIQVYDKESLLDPRFVR